ncbi:MAG: GIY-YIG nuclease family protein [Lactobacillaceae bacterium]|nr:GIY-YIG nuclease family protein [Lactobacillaceae bacterium]
MADYYFYVLHTADDKLYAGTSDDYLRRFETHKAFKGAKFTKVKSHHPLSLIYVEKFDSKGEALSFENKFKRLTRVQKDDYIQTHQNLIKEIVV